MRSEIYVLAPQSLIRGFATSASFHLFIRNLVPSSNKLNLNLLFTQMPSLRDESLRVTGPGRIVFMLLIHLNADKKNLVKNEGLKMGKGNSVWKFKEKKLST